MSTETVAATPVTTAAPVQPDVTPTAEPTEPLSKHEVRAQLNAERFASREAATTDGRVRDPASGRFVKSDAVTETAVDAADLDAPTAERAADGSPEPKAGPRPIRVEINPDHPVAGMGIPALEVGDEQQAQAVRALLNGTYTRRQENERLQSQLEEARTQLIQLQVSQASAARFKALPSYAEAAERYQEILDTVGQDAAAMFWRGYEQEELGKIQQEEYATRMAAWQAEEEDAAANEFTQDAWQRTATVPDAIRALPNFPVWFEEAVHGFNTELETQIALGRAPQYESLEQLHKAFEDYFIARLRREPAAIEVVNRLVAQRNSQFAPVTPAPSAEEAAQAKLREIAERRAAAPPHPMGTVAGATRAGRASGTGEPEPLDASNMTTHQLKRAAKASAREDARRRFGF